MQTEIAEKEGLSTKMKRLYTTLKQSQKNDGAVDQLFASVFDDANPESETNVIDDFQE